MAIWDIKERNDLVRANNDVKGTKGFFGGGYVAPANNTSIDIVDFVAGGNVRDFGDLANAFNQQGGGNAGSSTRGFIRFGGEGSPAYTTASEVITLTGGLGAKAQSFGDLTVGASAKGSLSSNTRALAAGGAIAPAGGAQDVIDVFTIATAGDAADFGNLSVARTGIEGVASPTRGVFCGGFVGPSTMKNEIDFVAIATNGNASDFGDLTAARRHSGAGSNQVRGVIGGGQISGALSNIIEYITIASTGNPTDFGDLTVARQTQAASNQISILFGGGSNRNEIDKVNIATTGNAIDFGDLTRTYLVHLSASNGHGGLDNSNSINLQRPSVTYMPGSGRGLFGGGYTPTIIKKIDVINIQTLGNASDFGDLTQNLRDTAGNSSLTRALFGMGRTPSDSNIIESIEMQSLGNAADFGNLTVSGRGGDGMSSLTRATFGGGYVSPAITDTIGYVTIASAGDALDFGNLTNARDNVGAAGSSTRGVFAGGNEPGDSNVSMCFSSSTKEPSYFVINKGVGNICSNSSFIQDVYYILPLKSTM